MSEKYRMTVDLNVLEHLGINLYSNIAAVLTEAVANAWDADAENVEIKIDQNDKSIEIKDDGVGMTVDDMNEKYLRVGYRRREEDKEHGKLTAKGRKIMGRKGLGKLSLFSIAQCIDVQSTKGEQAHGLRMSIDGIHESVEKKQLFYQPDPLPDDQITVTEGTKIVLHEIKRQSLERGVVALRKRLARRFSVIGERYGFKIAINGEPITAQDRGDLPAAQFLWSFGDFKPDPCSIPNVEAQEKLPNRLDDWCQGWSVKGWIGTAGQPKDLDNKDTGNLNSVVVFARGRLFHENILDKVNDGRLYTKYLTGQIEVDFLDEDDEPDIATSDRQRIQEDDPRYEHLLSFLKSSLTKVERRWTELRRKYEVKKVEKSSPALTKWFDMLPSGSRQNAEMLIAKLSALPIDDEVNRKLVYSHGILAFERMRIRESTGDLITNLYDVDKLLSVLADRDALEASLYRDIVKSRLNVIKDFQKIIDENAKEKVLQRHLFHHLWLLDPTWERVNGSEVMESRLINAGVIVQDLSEKEKLGRVDIAYLTNTGKHILIELKKVNRQMALIELVQQGQTYVDKLKKILAAKNENYPNIEVVFVLGKPVNEEKDNPDRLKSFMAGISPGSRIVHYDTLITGACNAYSEYLTKSKEFEQLEQIVDQI